jgi:hypothetical protein
VTGAFTPSASITISPQFVFKVKVLFLYGALTSGGVMFFMECPFALVFLQLIFEGDVGAAAFAIVENPAVKITKVAATAADFVIFSCPKFNQLF